MFWTDLPNDLILELVSFTGWTHCISFNKKIYQLIKKKLQVQFQKVEMQPDFLTENGNLFPKMIPGAVSTERFRKFVKFYQTPILADLNKWRQLAFYHPDQLDNFISFPTSRGTRLSVQLFRESKRYCSLLLDAPHRTWGVYAALQNEDNKKIDFPLLVHLNRFKDEMMDDMLLDWLLLPTSFFQITLLYVAEIAKQNPCPTTRRFYFSLTEEQGDPKESLMIRGCREQARFCDSRIFCVNH